MKKLAILLFGVFAISTSVQASLVYEFIDLDDPNFADVGHPTTGWVVDSNLTITAGSSQGGSDYHAYQDGFYNSLPGGLGVCKTDTQSCGNDDNHSSLGEYIRMSFLEGVEVESLNVIGNHEEVRRGTILNYEFNEDGTVHTAPIGLLTLVDVILAANSNVTTLDYWITNDYGEAEFYVTSMKVVPIPAAAWLFGTAILGLMGMRRKSKLEAVTA